MPIERTHGIYIGNIYISVAARFSLYFLIIYQNHLYSLLFGHLGGILGWDPVLTTCILVREDNSWTSHETQHGNHRVDHEKNCEAIYWKHHTSHHLTKISHTITFKTFFFTKIPFLLETSKIPYLNQVR